MNNNINQNVNKNDALCELKKLYQLTTIVQYIYSSLLENPDSTVIVFYTPAISGIQIIPVGTHRSMSYNFELNMEELKTQLSNIEFLECIPNSSSIITKLLVKIK